MEELSKNIYIQLFKKGLNIQEALAVLDEVKTLLEVGMNFKKCLHCGAINFYEDAKFCPQCGKKMPNHF